MVGRNVPTLTERVLLNISTKVVNRVHYGMLSTNVYLDRKLYLSRVVFAKYIRG
jgi:hypothetical protein